jgi:hypothetical protein
MSFGKAKIRGWAAECTCPPRQSQARLCPPDNQHRWKGPSQRTREVVLDPGASTDTPDRNQGQAGACPDRTRAIPCKVRADTAEVFIIRNMRGMVSPSGSPPVSVPAACPMR